MTPRRTFVLAAAATILAVGHASAAQGDDMSIGSVDAPLSLVEYASATCPHCATFHAQNWEALQSTYIERGLVRFTLRELYTAPGSVALAMFQLARAGGADPQEYFRRLAILFQRQRSILETGDMAGVREALIGLGGEWGLDASVVLSALTDPAGPERARRLIAEAAQRGVTSTPAFFLNDAPVTDPDFRAPGGMARFLDARISRRR